MPDNGSQDELTLRRLPEGGFIVVAKGYVGEFGNILFGSDEIDTALSYLKAQILPIDRNQEKAGSLLSQPLGNIDCICSKEGGVWKSPKDWDGFSVHAIRFTDGRIWDECNGWRG